MATKLDQTIALVTEKYIREGWTGLLREASLAASGLSAKDIAKLPNRTMPAVTAAKAGLRDEAHRWDHAWFESVVELLFQCGDPGESALWLLAERETFTYPPYVVVRLLRLAVERNDDTVNQRLRGLFASLHYTKTFQAVSEVIVFASHDARPLEHLKRFADVELPNADGETLGQCLARQLTHR